MSKAILSSPIGFAGTTMSFEEVQFPQSLEGFVSFVGHPATKALVEALGASTVTGKFAGLQIGESFIAVPLANNPREGGFTKDVAIESVAALKCILCTRVA